MKAIFSIEFVGFSEFDWVRLAMLRSLMRVIPPDGSFEWIEWDGSMRADGRGPAVSIVNALSKGGWQTVAHLVNGCHCDNIVLSGVDRPLLGLPVLRSNENLDELIELFGLMIAYRQELSLSLSNVNRTSAAFRANRV